MKKSSKSQSGVLVITVLTSPYPKFGNKVQNLGLVLGLGLGLG